MLEDREIEALLRSHAQGALNGACETLIAEANARGGHDNVTVVLLRAE
jgi:serine/threonine protein phosphatase PrpC